MTSLACMTPKPHEESTLISCRERLPRQSYQSASTHILGVQDNHRATSSGFLTIVAILSRNPSGQSVNAPASLVTRPFELLEFIVTHLIPKTDPYDTFPCSYSASTRSDNLPPFHSANLIRLSRTCRRMHALAKKALRQEPEHQQRRVNVVPIKIIFGNDDKYGAASRRYGLAQKPSWRV